MNNDNNHFVGKWNSVYFFTPLFEYPVMMPPENEFLDALFRQFGEVKFLSEEMKLPKAPSQLTNFVLLDYPSYYQKNKVSLPSQLMLYGANIFDKTTFDASMVAQFWGMDDKDAFINRCNYSINASNFMASALPRMERYGIIASYADLILEMFPDCIGIYWPHSQKITTREQYLNSEWGTKEFHFLDGGVNVRFFNIEGTDEMLFDTLGLTPIGLPDLQCHCKNLAPNKVVNFLNNITAYLYDKGDVIEDGNTVEGIGGEKWICQREDAIVGPNRMVIDINAGQFSAGNR